MIFLDEFNRGSKDILNAMFSLALDKTFHTIKLPSNCYIVAAGNPPTEEYYVTDVNETALMARFAHVKLEPTFDEWVSYANDNNINNELINFLKEQPQLLEDAKSEFSLPVKVDRRSYERLNRLYELKTPQYLLEQLMQGIIGLERTVAFKEFSSKQEKPLTGLEILNGDFKSRLNSMSISGNVKASLIKLSCDNLMDYWKTLSDVELKEFYKLNILNFLRSIPLEYSYMTLSNLMILKDNPNEKCAASILNFFTDHLYEAELVKLVRKAKGKQ